MYCKHNCLKHTIVSDDMDNQAKIPYILDAVCKCGVSFLLQVYEGTSKVNSVAFGMIVCGILPSSRFQNGRWFVEYHASPDVT